MTKTIALAGKGGTGKTTVSALIIKSLVLQGAGAVLAIDADPSTNLHLALGLPMPVTVGEIREGMTDPAMSSTLGVTVSRQDFLNREIFMALEEGDRVDLLAMGRPEGQGCYCAVNHLLRQVVDDLEGGYDYVVIDNEAGMEHISRRTTKGVDLLLIVTDPTIRGMRAASSIAQIASEVDVDVRRMGLIINRVQGDLPEPLNDAIEALGLEVLAMIPADAQINENDALGESLLSLNGDSPAWMTIDDLMRKLAQEM
jgi:CO dehydrogenase maturation factor